MISFSEGDAEVNDRIADVINEKYSLTKIENTQIVYLYRCPWSRSPR